MFQISCQTTMSRFIKVLPVVAVLIGMGVTGAPALGDGACCLDGGICTTVPDQAACDALFGNAFADGNPCTVDEACCETEEGPSGTCFMADPVCCAAMGNTPMGAGVSCAAEEEACCLPGGGCDLADPLCCEEMGGVSQGAGSTCDGPGTCSAPVPAVSEWGAVVMVLLVLAAATVVFRKRRALRTAA